MANELDPRIVIIGITVNGQVKSYNRLSITATGMKYANANQNEAEVTLYNLDKTTQDYILTETSAFNLNRTPKLLTIDAGRQSYGTTRVYEGNIISSKITQPPDTGILLKCLTGNFQKGNIIARSQAGKASLSTIAGAIASDLNLKLNFQANNRTVSNYSFSGASLKQVDALGNMGSVDAYVDNGILVVKEKNLPLSNTLKFVDLENGMIGIPDITEQGLKVKFLLDNNTVLGGLLRVRSQVYSAVNGDYIIYKLGFEISTREVPFYYIAECKRLIQQSDVPL